MKLFILFVLFCCVFTINAQYITDPNEETKHPDYNPKQPHIANCNEYNADNTCKTCHGEFDLASNQCNAKTIEKGPVKTDASKKFVHAEIGWDTADGKCTKTINIVTAAGVAISDDKYSGDKSCLACAEYTADNKCKTCAEGYIENNGGCTPLSVNPFGDANTDKNCIYGAYVSGSPVCYTCSNGYIQNGNRCIPSDNINTFPEGCIRKEYVKITISGSDKKRIECRECRSGYKLVPSETHGFSCLRIDDKCIISDNSGSCQSCIPGYYPSSGQCTKCEVTMPQSMKYYKNQECESLPTTHCECNPNCYSSTSNYYACSSRHCDLFSEKEMSPINQKNPKCLRCEQGYKLVGTAGNDTCIPCTNGCFTNEQNTTCEKGYYLTVDKDNKNVCRKCEGKCKECTSKTHCIEGQMETKNEFYGHALNGLPCLDANCTLCSSEDPSICYKCRNSDSELIGGKCYMKFLAQQAPNEGVVFLDICRYFKQPAFITDKNASINYTSNGYFYHVEPAYKRGSINIVGKYADNNEQKDLYICKYRDFLPYYFRYYNKTLSCAGAHRDVNNDCECIDEYYPLSADKTSDCKKTTVPYCKKAISETICGKCYDGMVLHNDGSRSYPILRCGCPQTYQRINHHGVCVDCPTICSTCETENLNNSQYRTKCLTCNGQAEFPGEEAELTAKNFNRNVTNLCKCNDTYATLTDETNIFSSNRNSIYSCYQIPRNCRNTNNHIIDKYNVKCKSCDKTGFTLESGCESCSKGYHGVVKNETIIECKRCPVIEGDITYCIECNEANECLECVDANLNKTNQCKTCNEGYSMVYVDYTGDSTAFVNPKPVCIKNEDYCKVLQTGTSFYAPKDATEQQYNTYKTKSKTNPYTKAEYEGFDKTYTVYCYQCAGTGQQPHQNCKCQNDYYRAQDKQCKQCSEIFGKQQFTTKDLQGNPKNATYNDVCNFTSVDAGIPLCEYISYRDAFQCKSCKNFQRTPSSNCLECLSTTTFPVFDGTNHICKQCLAKCATCTNDKNCTTCKGAGVTGANCDQCSKGFFKSSTDSTTGAAVCTKCNSTCASCDGSATKCTSCTTANHIPGPNHDCKACEVGFYYNIATDTCNAVNSKNGFSESVVICKNKADNKTIPCTSNLTEANTIFEERPIRCDTTRGVGISPYPVNGLCVCDTGYLDIRNATEIAKDPLPHCTSVKDIAKDPFCVDGKFDDNNKTKVICKKCNADYLEIVDGKCKCKKTHYTTSWGMCVPCGRHNKGCQECTGKYVCTKCDDKAYKLGSEEKNSKGEVTRKCVGK